MDAMMVEVTVELAVVEADMPVDENSEIDKQAVSLRVLVTVMSGLVLESPFP